MSTPPPEYAAQLAEQTANAVLAARTSLQYAADLADAVDTMLRRAEDDILELPGQARRALDAEEARPFLRNAQGIAEDIDRRLRGGQRSLQELSDRLEQAARELNHGRQFLTELEDLPGRRSESTDRLRRRVDGLGQAVVAAEATVGEARGRLAQARANLEPLLSTTGYDASRQQAAALINETGSGVEAPVTRTRSGLRELRAEFGQSEQDANRAAYESAELANAVRAGLNPSPGRPPSQPAATRQTGSPSAASHRTAAQQTSSQETGEAAPSNVTHLDHRRRARTTRQPTDRGL